MSKSSRLLIAVGAVAGVLLVAVALSRTGSKRPEAETQPPADEPAPVASTDTSPPSFFTKRPGRRPSPLITRDQPAEGAPAATNATPAWEDKLDEILGGAAPEADKARQMLEMFPQLPADGQEEVAQHLSNLLSDADFGLLHAQLTNAALAEPVLEVLLGDVLNRPNSLKLPALLEVARSPQHPKAAEAREFLEFFLEEDHGEDWEKWQARMQEWLKDNPD